MVDALGDLIPYAVGVALSPIPLIAVFLLFQSPSPRAASGAFLAGRLVTVTAVALIAALGAELLPELTGPSAVGGWLRIVLGAALMVWAVTKVVSWLGTRENTELPAWMASVEQASPGRAAVLGVIVSAANVKELAFGLGAGLTIAAADPSVGATVALAVVYALMACAALLAVVVMFWFAADRVGESLDRARNWLVRNNKVIVAVVLLVIGALLVGGGVSAL